MAYRPLPDASQIEVWGNLDSRFRAALTRLTEGPEYTTEFILSDVTGDYWRVFTEYCGDICGRYIGAVGLGRTYTREKAADRVDEIVKGTIAAQKPDGHFNLEQPLEKVYYPLIYGHGRLLQGLVEYHTVAPDPQTLETIRRLTDYYAETLPYYQEAAKTFNEEFIYYTQSIEGVVGAYRLTGDTRHLDLARAMAELIWDEPKHHSHSYISSLLGVLAIYEVTGEQRWLDFAEKKQGEIAGMVTVDGGVTEMLPDKHVTEFCSVADWFMYCLRLWRVTGKAHYLEVAERNLLNAVFFNQFSTGGFGTWRVNKTNGYPGRVEMGSGEAYWCCCFHGVRALYDALTHIYTYEPDAVRVNLFFDSAVRLPHASGVTIRQETTYPAEGTVRLCVSSPENTPLTLHVRVPSWASKPSLTVNGKTAPLEVTDGYAAIHREWGSADVVELAFDMGLRLEEMGRLVEGERLKVGAELTGVTFWRGPLVMAVDELFNALGPSDEKNHWTAPDRLILPPFTAEGVCALPRREKPLAVPLEWPGIMFETPAEWSSEGEGDRSPRRVVLTPLARRITDQPACAPSSRIRYQARILPRDEWEKVRGAA